MPQPLIGRRKVAVLAKGVVGRARRGFRLPRLGFPYAAPPIPTSVEMPEDTSNIGANYDTEWARRPSARLARTALVETVIRPSISMIAKPHRQGYDRLRALPRDQSALFVANHHSHLDTSLLLTSIPLPWRHKLVVAAASDYFFDKRMKATMSALTIGAFPINRHSMGRASADQAAEIINAGNSILIYPEGGRSPDGWGQPFKGGAAYLALRCGVPIVPIYLAGTGRIWRKGQRWPKPSTTSVIFGDPIWPTETDNTRRLNARIESAVATLGDELATDWWQARKRFHQHGAPSMSGPEVSSWQRAWALGDRTRRSRKKPVWPR
ncbi:MAG: lysophospholipid acyltransferase family protein [Acidimicrobiales bacterium]